MVARALAEKHGLTLLSFATALKEDVVMMGFDRDVVYNQKPPWMRALLQAYGQARRAQDEDYWLNRIRSAVHLCKPTTIFIIDDVRFTNEAIYVEEMGTLVRIERPGYTNRDTDQSEIELDGWDFDHTVHGDEGPQGVIDLVCHVEDVLWAEGIIE